MTAQARDLAALSRQYDPHRAAVVAWGEAQIAAGNDAAEVMGRVFFALDQLDLRQAEATEDLKHRAGELTEFQKQAFRNMESAAGTFFFDAMQGNFDNMLDGFLSMTQRMVAEWTAAQAMMGLFGDEFGRGGSLGGLLGTAASALGGWLGGGSAGGVTAASTSGDSLTSIAYDSGWLSRPSYSFGGHRAGGGAVSSGKMYEVTEGGIPELLFTGGKQYLMMGQNSGMVIPATAAPAGGGSSSSVQPQAPAPIYVTIIAADAQSITDMMRRNPQAVLGPLRDALQKGDRGLRGDLQRVLQ